MWNLKLNQFIKDNHLFYFLMKNHKKSQNLLKGYNKEYHILISEVIHYLESISLDSKEKYYVSYLFDVSKNDFSCCSPYREDVYSIYYKDNINIFKVSNDFLCFPEEAGDSGIYLGKTELPPVKIFNEASDYREGCLLYTETKKFIYSLIEDDKKVVNSLKDIIYEEFRSVRSLYDLLKRYPFLIKYFPENYLKKEREWMFENLEHYPIPSDEEAYLFEINLL